MGAWVNFHGMLRTYGSGRNREMTIGCRLVAASLEPAVVTLACVEIVKS